MKIVVNIEAAESFIFDVYKYTNCTKVRRYYYEDHKENVRNLLASVVQLEKPVFTTDEINTMLENEYIFREDVSPSGTPLVLDKPHLQVTIYRY